MLQLKFTNEDGTITILNYDYIKKMTLLDRSGEDRPYKIILLNTDGNEFVLSYSTYDARETVLSYIETRSGTLNVDEPLLTAE